MVNGNFNIKIISQSNEIMVEKDIVKYEWLTENSINIYDKENKKTRYLLGASLLIIEEIGKDDK